MLANGSRKRASSDAHDDLSYDCGPRCSQRLRLRATDQDRDGAQNSSPMASPTPPPPSSATPAKRSDVRQTILSHQCGIDTSGPLRSEQEKKREFTFFSFPGELRNMIYSYSLNYPDSRQLYATYYQRPAINTDLPKWEPRLRAPTILLLNKRITRESLPFLKSTKLVIDRLPPPRTSDIRKQPIDYFWGYPRPSYFMRLSEFISPCALQNIPQIDVNVGLGEGPLGSGWAWTRVVNELLILLTQRNACVKLRFLCRLCNIEDSPNLLQSETDYRDLIFKNIELFARRNPNVFAQREVTTELWTIEGRKATFKEEHSFPLPMILENERFEDVTLEEGLPEKKPKPAPRLYPDREMFPGSVMEFLRPAPPPFYSHDDSD